MASTFPLEKDGGEHPFYVTFRKLAPSASILVPNPQSLNPSHPLLSFSVLAVIRPPF